MGRQFAEIAFTARVKDRQIRDGSRTAYARLEAEGPDDSVLGSAEIGFIAERDSFYMASIIENGWPYLQHRGGPPGFVKVLGPETVGFADYRGNRQLVSAGNVDGDDRVALFFMDYPNRRRLKIFGHAAVLEAKDAAALAKRLGDPAYRARVERIVTVKVAGFDWNCPQHITPRLAPGELTTILEPLKARLAELEAENARLRSLRGGDLA